MSLRRKTLLIITVSFILLFNVIYLTSKKILTESYARLERQDMVRECGIVSDTINNEIAQLDIKTGDWAVWDDTWNFMNDLSRAYIKSNLNAIALELLKIDFIFYINMSGRVVYSIAIDKNKNELVTPPQGFPAHLAQGMVLSEPMKVNDSVSGILKLDGRPALVAASPIVRSDGTGPVRGTLVMGRFFDSALLKKISETVHLEILMRTPEKKELENLTGRSGVVPVFDSHVAVKPLNNEIVSGYIFLIDLYRKPVLVFQINHTRHVFLQGLRSIRYLLFAISAAAIVFGLIIIIIMERTVLSRISSLNSSINSIRQSADPDLRVDEEGSDEIGNLALSINSMLEAIRSSNETTARTEKRLSVTLRSIAEGVITIDVQGCVVLMNPAAGELTGRDPDESEGMNIDDIFKIVDEKTSLPCNDRIWSVLSGDRDKGFPENTALVDGAGKMVSLELECSPVFGNDNMTEGAVIVFRDTREKRKMEQAILRTRKLESIQGLAGGIAHDFNNILMSIIGNISFLKVRNGSDREVFETLEETEKACFRARDLTSQLLTFSKGGAPVKKSSYINDIIEETAAFILRGANVKSEVSLATDLWAAEIDEGQIHQVISNILMNAKQAMPDGGIVTISAENVNISEKCSISSKTYPHIRAGKYLRVIIRDTGSGIPEENISRIFDPYFTTREDGNGLGLAIVFSIIKKHDGFIDIETEPGRGTAFYLYLPSTGEPADRSSRKVKGIIPGRGRVLIMDDDEFILKSLGKMLIYLGYDVEMARNGSEAVHKYSDAMKSGETFKTVIMDLTVPGEMGGKDAVRKLIEIDPGVNAVVSSGYSNDPILSDFRNYGFCAVIVKPYNMEDLSELMSRIDLQVE